MSALARTLGRLGTPIAKRARSLAASRWPPHSRLILASDAEHWVIGDEMRQLARIAGRLGIKTAPAAWMDDCRDQCVFFGSQFRALLGPPLDRPHRVAMAYFHGRPGTGVPEFDACFQRLRETHERIDRVQVSCRSMREIVLGSGIAPEKVHLIPIGVDLARFAEPGPKARESARRALGLPDSAFVVGSFQKDGSGWGEGLEPKPVKGPDVFLRVIELLKPRIPELHVLLSGPARGFVKEGLARFGVPHRHEYLKNPEEIGRLYSALDAYLVCSRDEGGPKGAIEAMAAGVPLVTTRVGQAADLVRHGENGWMCEIEDADALAFWTENIYRNAGALAPLLAEARRTAKACAYETQDGLWRAFMRGFAVFPDSV